LRRKILAGNRKKNANKTTERVERERETETEQREGESRRERRELEMV